MTQSTLRQSDMTTPPMVDDTTLRDARCAEHHATMRLHLFIAAGIGLLGMAMIMTGALMAFGVVTMCLAVFYAAGVAITGFMVNCFDLRWPAPRPEELDSAADYQRVKHTSAVATTPPAMSGSPRIVG